MSEPIKGDKPKTKKEPEPKTDPKPIKINVKGLDKLDENEKASVLAALAQSNKAIEELAALTTEQQKEIEKITSEADTAKKQSLIDKLVEADYKIDDLKYLSYDTLSALTKVLSTKDGIIKVPQGDTEPLEPKQAMISIIDPVQGQMNWEGGRWVKKESEKK